MVLGDGIELETGKVALEAVEARLAGNGLDRSNKTSGVLDNLRDIECVKDVINVKREMLASVIRIMLEMGDKVLS
jgi:hypothetical protein